MQIQPIGCSSYTTITQLGLQLNSVVKPDDLVYTYGAVNKTDERETKLLTSGMFVSYQRQSSNQVHIAIYVHNNYNS